MANTTILTAPDIVCDGCASAIKKALGGLDGVQNVAVDIDAKTVAVTHAPDVAPDALADALDEAGFPTAGGDGRLSAVATE
jgi:copper chaperone CopZ